MQHRALSTRSEGRYFQPCLPNEAVVSAEPDVAFTLQRQWVLDVSVHSLA